MDCLIRFGTIDEVDACRAPSYEALDKPLEYPEGVTWLVAERAGKVGACVGVRDDDVHSQRWLFDLLGVDALTLKALWTFLEEQADRDDMWLAGWMDVNNKNAKYAFAHDWKIDALLVSRPPKSKR